MCQFKVSYTQQVFLEILKSQSLVGQPFKNRLVKEKETLLVPPLERHSLQLFF